MADSCCSFASLSESPELYMVFILGISISCLLIHFCNISNPVSSVTEWHKTSGNGCCSRDCLRCNPAERCIIRSKVTKRWERFCAEYKHGANSLNRVHEAMAQYAMSGEGTSRATCQRSRIQQPTVLYFPGLTSQPRWNRCSHIPLSLDTDLCLLEKNAVVIRTEFNKINALFLQKGCVGRKTSNGWAVNDRGWRMYHLVNQGTPVLNNIRRCPKTFALFRQLKYAMLGCIFGFASFSVVEPGAEIFTHCGPTNVRLRNHLGLNVPSECKLIVGKKSICWKEGESILFDDSYPHSVIHRGTCSRAVLLIDFWHPDLKNEERTALGYAFSAYDV